MTMSEKWGNPVQTKHGIAQLLIWFTFSATMLAVAMLTAQFPIWGNVFFNVVLGVLVLVFSKAVMFERLKAHDAFDLASGHRLVRRLWLERSNLHRLRVASAHHQHP